MADYTVLNLQHIVILSTLCFLIAACLLLAFIRTVGPVAEEATGRWIGRRPPKSKYAATLRPMQIIELDLPDGSTTRISTNAFRTQTLAPPEAADGRIEALCFSRLTPGYVFPRAQRTQKQIAYPLFALIFMAWANYCIAPLWQYKFPPAIYGIEAAIFIGALLIGFGNAGRARNVSWDSYREGNARKEKVFDEKYGEVDAAATVYDPALFQQDIAPVKKEKNPVLVLICLVLIILPLSVGALYIDWKDSAALFKNSYYAQATVTSVRTQDHDYYDSCDINIRFIADALTTRNMTGESMGAPTVQSSLQTSIFTPYCHTGDQLTVAYNLKNMLRGKPAIYANGWNLYGLVLETLLTLLLLYYFFKSALKRLGTRQKITT